MVGADKQLLIGGVRATGTLRQIITWIFDTNYIDTPVMVRGPTLSDIEESSRCKIISSPTLKTMIFTFLTLLVFLAGTVVAQGRPGVTRGQIFFGCYTARPTGSSTQPAPTQAANSATFSGCLVCPLLLPFYLSPSPL